MIQAHKRSLIAAVLLAVLITSAGCAVYDDDRYRWGRYDRYDRYSRLDLDRDGRVEQWERDRWDRDRDGRIEGWERDIGPSRYPYSGRDSYYGRDSWRYDSRYSDRFDR